MLSDSEARAIVGRFLARSERLGDQAGGSGHHGDVSATLDAVGPVEPVARPGGGAPAWRVPFTYTLVVTTEFTYYPDNPPREYRYARAIVVDAAGRVLSASEKTGVGGDAGGGAGAGEWGLPEEGKD